MKDSDFGPPMLHSQRARLMDGDFSGKHDIADFRRFVSMSQSEFAAALHISVHTLHNWEQGRRKPSGPSLALLRSAAKNPGSLRRELAASR